MASAKPKTAQEYHSDATRVTSKLFWAPPPRVTIIPCIVLSIVGGLVVAIPRLDWWIAAYAAALFGVPTLAAALLTKPLAEYLGGRTYFRRTALLALTGLTVAVGVAVISRGIEALVKVALPSNPGLSPQRLTILAWGVPLWLRHMVMLATSESRTSRSLPASSIQTLIAYLFTPLVLPFTVGDAVFAVLVFLFFLGSSMLFAELANRPMRKSFGYDGLWLMTQFLDHMTLRGSSSQDKVEGFFESISMPSQVHVGAIAFASASKMKAMVVVPSAHPGPMGTLGGSDLPRKLAYHLFELSPAVMVPKGPCTHDQNIATLAECRRIGDKARELIEGAKSLHGGTKSARATVGKATAMAQFFGETALIVCSLAPNPTDDIDTATGHAARQEAKAAGANDAIFVDAHNCMEVGSGLTHFGSRASHDIIAASRKAVERAKDLRFDTIGIGYASMPYTGNPDDGLGPLGIQVLVVEAGGQKTAYILLDSNNMVTGLREEMVESVKGMVDVAEVLTSDDHAVNMTLGGFNPAGMKMERARLVGNVKELTGLAVRDLSFSQSAAATGHIDDLRIFGPESSARLTTGINLTVAILKPALALSVSLAVTLALLALFLIP